MMDYRSSNSGGYMDTSFDGSSNNTGGFTRVTIVTIKNKNRFFDMAS